MSNPDLPCNEHLHSDLILLILIGFSRNIRDEMRKWRHKGNNPDADKSLKKPTPQPIPSVLQPFRPALYAGRKLAIVMPYNSPFLKLTIDKHCQKRPAGYEKL